MDPQSKKYAQALERFFKILLIGYFQNIPSPRTPYHSRVTCRISDSSKCCR